MCTSVYHTHALYSREAIAMRWHGWPAARATNGVRCHVGAGVEPPFSGEATVLLTSEPVLRP